MNEQTSALNTEIVVTYMAIVSELPGSLLQCQRYSRFVTSVS